MVSARTALKSPPPPACGAYGNGDATLTRAVGGVRIVVETAPSAVRAVRDAVFDRSAVVFGFCNAHTVNTARRDPDFAAALGQMILFNDGIGVDLASRLLDGEPFPDNLNGTDLTPAVLATLTRETSVFLLGSPPGIAELAARTLSERFPNLVVAGAEHGFFDEDEEPALAARIRMSGARLVLVGMGHPNQETWAARNAPAIGATILCIGAFLDFTAGRVQRAPPWVRTIRAEWAYRLFAEPRRMAGRYLIGNATFMVAVLRQWRSSR